MSEVEELRRLAEMTEADDYEDEYWVLRNRLLRRWMLDYWADCSAETVLKNLLPKDEEEAV